MANLNWEQLYAAENISKKWRLPDTRMIDTGEGTFRDLFLNWGDLPKKTETGDNIPAWFICCDVLRIDKDQLLEVTALVFARRIEIAPGKTIILNNQEEKSVDLLLFTQEIVDIATGEAAELPIFNLMNEDEKHSSFAQPAGQDIGGISWKGQEEAPLALTTDDLEDGFFNFDSPLVLLLNSQFQVGSLLSSDNIPASIAIMRWVAGITKYPQADQEMSGQAQSMLLNLISVASIADAETILVPKLDHSIYAGKAKALSDMLELHETQWDKLLDRSQDVQQWLADAKLAASEKDEQLALAANLAKQAESTWRSAQNASTIAAAQIVTLIGEMELLRINFNTGIEKWKRKVIITSSLQLALGVAEILVEIPVIIEAAPGLVPVQAFTSISEKLISEARARDEVINNALVGEGPRSDVAGVLEAQKAKIKDNRKKMKESGEKMVKAGIAIGGGAEKVLDAGMNIKDTIERANQLEETSQLILLNSFSTVNKVFSSIELQGLDIVTGGSQIWEEASIDLESVFSQITELQEIEGGNEFLVGLRKLILYGKAYCEARLAAAKANVYFAEMRIKQNSAKKTADLFAKRIDNLNLQSSQIQVLSQRLFTMMISDKRAVYLALESYNRALRYFTLSDGIQLPSMTDSYQNFRKTISAVIAGDQIVATKLDTPPQTMNKMTFEVVDENILASIREYGFANWNLPLDSEAFKHFGRVRLSEIRVFLQGVNSSKPIQVLIVTSGVYYDKDTTKETTSYRFVAEPLGMRFVYHNDTINIQADIAERFKDNYFHPTPFTNWSFHFSSEEAMDKLDFSTLSSLKIEFKGEVTSII